VAGLLLANKADVNSRDKNGETPLRWASKDSRKEVAELPLAKGAEVDARSKDGFTPLHEARQKDMVELLRQHGGHE
jgi:ankyrin repeat protein